MLRDALDREAGRHVAIDYPLILPHTRLLDERYLPRILTALRGLPIDNLVVRLSGFGADAGPLTVKRTLGAIEELQVLEYPILLDYVGGLVGLGALAFGIVSGIAHGIGERDRFDARSRHKPEPQPTEDRSFGRPIYVPLPGIGQVVSQRGLRGHRQDSRGAGDWSPAPIERVVRVD